MTDTPDLDEKDGFQKSDSFKEARKSEHGKRRQSLLKKKREKGHSQSKKPKYNKSLLSHDALKEKEEKRLQDIEENAIVEDMDEDIVDDTISSKVPSPVITAHKISKSKNKKSKKGNKTVQWADSTADNVGGGSSKKSGSNKRSRSRSKNRDRDSSRDNRDSSNSKRKRKMSTSSSKPGSARGDGPQKRFKSKNDGKGGKGSKGSKSKSGKSSKSGKNGKGGKRSKSKNKRRNSIDDSNGKDGGGDIDPRGLDDEEQEIAVDPMEDLRDATDGEVIKLLFKKLSKTSIFYYLLGNVGIALQKNKVNITNWLLIPPTNAEDANSKKREEIADLQDAIDKRKEYLKANVTGNDQNIQEKGLQKVFNGDHMLSQYEKRLLELRDTKDTANVMDNEVRRRIRYEINDRKLLHCVRHLLLKYCQMNKDKLRSFLRDKRTIATPVDLATPQERLEWQITSEIAAKEAPNFEPTEVMNALPKREKIRIYTYLRDKFSGMDNSLHGECTRHALGPAPLNPQTTNYPASRLYYDSHYNVEKKEWEHFDIVEDDRNSKNKNEEEKKEDEKKDGENKTENEDEKAATLDELNGNNNNNGQKGKVKKKKWKQNRRRIRNDLFEKPHVLRDDAIEKWESSNIAFNPRAPSFVTHDLRLDKDISSLTNQQVIIDILIRYNHIAHKHLSMVGDADKFPQVYVSLDRMRMWESIREIEKYRTAKLEEEMKEKYEEKIKRMMTNIELLAREINQSRSTMERILHGMQGKKSRFDSIKKEFRSLSEQIEAQDTKSDQYLNNLRFEERFTPAAQANAKFMKLLKENKKLSDQIKRLNEEYDTLMQNTDGRRLEAEFAEMKEQQPIIEKHKKIVSSLSKVKQAYVFTWQTMTTFLNKFFKHLEDRTREEEKELEKMRRIKENAMNNDDGLTDHLIQHSHDPSITPQTISEALVPRKSQNLSLDENRPDFGRFSTRLSVHGNDMLGARGKGLAHLRKKSGQMSYQMLKFQNQLPSNVKLGAFAEDKDDDEIEAEKANKIVGLNLMSHITEESKTETEMEMSVSMSIHTQRSDGVEPPDSTGDGKQDKNREHSEELDGRHDRARASDELDKKSDDSKEDTKDEDHDKDKDKEQSAASKDSRESTESREVSRDLDKDDDDDDDGDKEDDNLAEDDNDEEEHANEKRTDYKAKVIAKFKKYMDLDWIDQEMKDKIEEEEEKIAIARQEKEKQLNMENDGFGYGHGLHDFFRGLATRVNATNIRYGDDENVGDDDEENNRAHIEKAENDADEKYKQLYKEYYDNYVISKDKFDRTKEKYDKLYEWENAKLLTAEEKLKQHFAEALEPVEPSTTRINITADDMDDLSGHIGADNDFDNDDEDTGNGDVFQYNNYDTYDNDNNDNEDGKEFVDTFDPGFDVDAYVNERLYDESETDSDKGSDDFGQEDEEKVKESYLPFTTDPEGPEFYPKIDLDAVFRNDNIKYSKNVTNTLWKEHPIIKEVFEREMRELEMWGPISNRRQQALLKTMGQTRGRTPYSTRYSPTDSRDSFTGMFDPLGPVGASASSLTLMSTESNKSRRHSPRASGASASQSRSASKDPKRDSLSRKTSGLGKIHDDPQDYDDRDFVEDIGHTPQVAFDDATLEEPSRDSRYSGIVTGTHTPGGRSSSRRRKDGRKSAGTRTPSRRRKHKKDKKSHSKSKSRSKSRQRSRHHSRRASKEVSLEASILGQETKRKKRKKDRKKKRRKKSRRGGRNDDGRNDDGDQTEFTTDADADATDTDFEEILVNPGENLLKQASLGGSDTISHSSITRIGPTDSTFSLQSNKGGPTVDTSSDTNSNASSVTPGKSKGKGKRIKSPKIGGARQATKNIESQRITDRFFGPDKNKKTVKMAPSGKAQVGKQGYIGGPDQEVQESGFVMESDADTETDIDDRRPAPRDHDPNDNNVNDNETTDMDETDGDTPRAGFEQQSRDRGPSQVLSGDTPVLDSVHGTPNTGGSSSGGGGSSMIRGDSTNQFNLPGTSFSQLIRKQGTGVGVIDPNDELSDFSDGEPPNYASQISHDPSFKRDRSYKQDQSFKYSRMQSGGQSFIRGNMNQGQSESHFNRMQSTDTDFQRGDSNYYNRQSSDIQGARGRGSSIIEPHHAKRQSTFAPQMGAIDEYEDVDDDDDNLQGSFAGQGTSFKQGSFQKYQQGSFNQGSFNQGSFNNRRRDDYDSPSDNEDGGRGYRRAGSSNIHSSNMGDSQMGGSGLGSQMGSTFGTGNSPFGRNDSSGMILHNSASKLKTRASSGKSGTGSGTGSGSSSFMKQQSNLSNQSKQSSNAYQSYGSSRESDIRGNNGASTSYIQQGRGGRFRADSDLDSTGGPRKQISSSMIRGGGNNGSSGMLREGSGLSNDGSGIINRQGSGLSDNGFGGSGIGLGSSGGSGRLDSPHSNVSQSYVGGGRGKKGGKNKNRNRNNNKNNYNKDDDGSFRSFKPNDDANERLSQMGASQSQLLQMGDSGDIERPVSASARGHDHEPRPPSASAKRGDDHDPSVLDRLHNIDGDSDDNHDPTGDYDESDHYSEDDDY